MSWQSQQFDHARRREKTSRAHNTNASKALPNPSGAHKPLRALLLECYALAENYYIASVCHIVFIISHRPCSRQCCTLSSLLTFTQDIAGHSITHRVQQSAHGEPSAAYFCIPCPLPRTDSHCQPLRIDPSGARLCNLLVQDSLFYNGTKYPRHCQELQHVQQGVSRPPSQHTMSCV